MSNVGQAIHIKKLGLNAQTGEQFKIFGKEGFYAIGEITEKDGEKALKSKKIFFYTEGFYTDYGIYTNAEFRCINKYRNYIDAGKPPIGTTPAIYSGRLFIR